MPTPPPPKPLCDWSKKDLRERWNELVDLVASPRYGCTKCGRVARGKRVLCKPEPLVPSSKTEP